MLREDLDTFLANLFPKYGVTYYEGISINQVSIFSFSFSFSFLISFFISSSLPLLLLLILFDQETKIWEKRKRIQRCGAMQVRCRGLCGERTFVWTKHSTEETTTLDSHAMQVFFPSSPPCSLSPRLHSSLVLFLLLLSPLYSPFNNLPQERCTTVLKEGGCGSFLLTTTRSAWASSLMSIDTRIRFKRNTKERRRSEREKKE